MLFVHIGFSRYMSFSKNRMCLDHESSQYFLNKFDFQTGTLSFRRREYLFSGIFPSILINDVWFQGEIHELLALVYYDGLQNVVPFYDQRSIIPSKDALWTMFCENSMRHFKKAFAHKYFIFTHLVYYTFYTREF